MSFCALSEAKGMDITMKFFILTDLEGVVGVDKFTQTRVQGLGEAKVPGMKQLAREVNACISGIHDGDPDAQIDVWDGHGPGGLIPEEVVGGRYISGSEKPYFNLRGFDAMLFVGQHAMAGTVFAPLCHTYSSLNIQHYKLNGIFIGEFGARALLAGFQGVPTIYLSGDDKAVSEARSFIPEIETTIVKQGTGLESAVHQDADAACTMIRRDTARAVSRMKSIPPFVGIKPPYQLEIRRYAPYGNIRKDAEKIDDRTIMLKADTIFELNMF
jgi:D-amino peptidase